METKRILLIDDEKSFTNLLKLNLEDSGDYEVRVVNEPEDAIPTAREFLPHIILLDIIMPRLAGGDVAAKMDVDPLLKEIPIVFLTAAVRKHQVEENDGIISDRPCLAKPVSLEEVIDAIEKHTSS